MKSTLGGTWRVSPLAAAVGRSKWSVAYVPGRLTFVDFLVTVPYFHVWPFLHGTSLQTLTCQSSLVTLLGSISQVTQSLGAVSVGDPVTVTRTRVASAEL
jgi:hypothetical protein